MIATRLLALFLLANFALNLPAQTPAPVARTNAAIVPAERDQERPRQRYEQLNQRVKDSQGKVDLVFLGDSITQGWEGSGKNVWQRYYGHRRALNLGIGGDRTQHILWRMDHGNLDGIQPKALVLMIGTNNSNKEDHTPGEILEGVTAIIRRLREKLPETKVLLLGIFPRGATFSDQRGKILQVNQALARLDDGRSVFYLDFGSQLIESNGAIAKAVMPDYLHLSERGYQIWAEAIEPKLAALLGDSPVSAAAGAWLWKMKGPNGEDVEGPMELTITGSKVTGEFRSGADRVLKIEKGLIEGNELKFTVPRDRPQGGTMVYEMTGTVTGGTIEGTAEAEFNGQKRKVPWSARRPEPAK